MAYVAGAVVTRHHWGGPPGRHRQPLRDLIIGTGAPEHTLYAAHDPAGLPHHLIDREDVGPRDIVDVHEVAHLAPVLEDPRRPAGFERGAKDRGDPRVGGVARHPRAVDVVIPQPDRPRLCLSCPGERVVLLGDLARGVAAPRVQPGVLGDEFPGQRSITVGAVVLEVAGVQRRLAAWGRRLMTVLAARVAPLAVDDHRAGEDEGVHAPLVHRREQCRRAEVVVAGVRREVGHGHPGPHHRGLVAHDIDTVEQVGPLGCIAYVDPVNVLRGGGCGPVGLGDERVDTDDLVTSYGSAARRCAPR